MIKHANKILYVGAGCHIEPVTHFPETKQFIFIDSQPRSEFDSFHTKFDNEFYRPHFIDKLLSSCQNYGFILDSYTILDKKYYKKIISKKWYYFSWFYKIPYDINPTMLVFTNKKTHQRLTYYISTNIKFNMNNILQIDICTCDGIIISKYFPENEIFRYFVYPKVLFGYTDTCYFIEKDTKQQKNNNILYFLHNSICNTQYYFVEFYMIYNDSGVIIKCQDFKHFVETNEEYDNLMLQQIKDDKIDSEKTYEYNSNAI